MGKGSGNGTTRGDRKRNARRERLRELLPRDGAVIGIDLASSLEGKVEAAGRKYPIEKAYGRADKYTAYLDPDPQTKT